MRLFNIALLATGLVIDNAAEFRNNERALTVADLPPCGVRRFCLSLHMAD